MKYVFLIALFWFLLDRLRHPKHPLQLNVYFGVPGSGKTTYAAYLAKQARKESIIIRLCRRFPCRFTNWILSGNNWKRAYPVWSNVPIAGTLRLNAREDIGGTTNPSLRRQSSFSSITVTMAFLWTCFPSPLRIWT